MKTTTFRCETQISDGRCPDGCCGDVTIRVRSPKTGRDVRCSLHLAGAAVGAKVGKALPGTFCPSRGRTVRDAIGRVDFTAAELAALLKADGKFDPN